MSKDTSESVSKGGLVTVFGGDVKRVAADKSLISFIVELASIKFCIVNRWTRFEAWVLHKMLEKEHSIQDKTSLLTS